MDWNTWVEKQDALTGVDGAEWADSYEMGCRNSLEPLAVEARKQKVIGVEAAKLLGLIRELKRLRGTA